MPVELDSDQATEQDNVDAELAGFERNGTCWW